MFEDGKQNCEREPGGCLCFQLINKFDQLKETRNLDKDGRLLK